MRQIAGAFAQYEKAPLVARLRRARKLKSKVGGRKSLTETRPKVVELARKLRRTRSGKQCSSREISTELAARGFVAERTGRPYEAAQVSRILKKLRTASRHSEVGVTCHGQSTESRTSKSSNKISEFDCAPEAL
jgi:hypothetical protein